MNIEKCKKCNKPFMVSEYILTMPGTKEREYVKCPYCKYSYPYLVTNGWWETRKLTEVELDKYLNNDKG